MAVYYKWIKGCSEGSTLNSGLWSYIDWGKLTNTESQDYIKGVLDIKYLPKIQVSVGMKNSGRVDFGNILTTNARNVKISKAWRFLGSTEGSRDLGVNGNILTVYKRNTDELDDYLISESKMKLNKGFLSNGDVEIKNTNIQNATSSLKVEIESYLKNSVTIGADTKISSLGEYQLGVAGIIKSNDSVHAPYFNATSDMRAKENIKKLPFSALSFINNLNVYQFNYKGKNDTVPGVLAQDVLNSQPEGLSLVDNIDASGENGDYMSIKEDKFIFILMRAIQELKEDNDSLRYELEQLKQKIK